MKCDYIVNVVILLLLALAVFIIFGSIFQVHAISILTFGDISCSPESLKTMDNVIAYLQANKVDRVVFLGDAQYGDSWKQCTEHFFLQVKQYAPLRFVWGNHENDNFSKLVEKPFRSDVWNETVSGTLLIGMNTNEPWNQSSSQYNKIDKILETTVAEYKLMFSHKHSVDNCRPDKDQFMCGFYELYSPMWKKYRVDCVVTGHLHMIAMLNKDGVCYGIYGMGGALPYALHHTFFGSQTLYKSTVEHGFTVIYQTPTGLMHAFHANSGDLIRKHFAEK